jgi:hypothetical protein
MPEKIRILDVERDGDDGLIVTFSDGTTAAYVVEELLELRPGREPIRKPPARNEALSRDSDTPGRIEWRESLLRLQEGI